MKFSLLMPVLTALSALALLINSSLFADDKRKRATGVITKTSEGELLLKQADKQLSIALTPETQVHFNAQKLSPEHIQSGRTATVVFSKSKGKLVAQSVDVFPVADDFQQG